MKQTKLKYIIFAILLFVLCQCNSQPDEVKTSSLENVVHDFKFNDQTKLPFIPIWFNDNVSGNMTFGMHFFVIAPYELKANSAKLLEIIAPNQNTYQITKSFQKKIASACESETQNYLLIPLDMEKAETLVDMHSILSFNDIEEYPKLLNIINITLGLGENLQLHELITLMHSCGE